MADSDHTTLIIIDKAHGSAEAYQRLLRHNIDVSYQILAGQHDGPILSLCQSRQVDAILLEAHAEGVAALLQLQSQMGKICPPVIVIGENDAALAVRVMNAGAATYLVRDQLTADALSRAIQTAIAPSQSLQNGEETGNATAATLMQATRSDSQERYQTLLMSIDEAFCILQVIFNDAGTCIDYRYLELNPLFEQQTGLKNALGKTTREMVPDIESYWFDIYGAVALTGKPARFTDYSESMGRWFDVNAFRIDEPQKRRVAVLLKDITAQKQAEATAAADLRDTQLLHDLSTRLTSEASIQTLYDEIMAAAIALLRADAGAVQILDDATQELVLIAFQGFDQAMIEQLHRTSANSRTPCGMALTTSDRIFVDFDALDSDDVDDALHACIEAGYLSAQATPLVARSGRLIGMVSTQWRTRHRSSERELRFLDLLVRQAADLIEHRQAEQALRQSEAKYRTLFEQISEGYAIAEIIVNENGEAVDYRMLEVNPKFEQLTGLSCDVALSGKTIRDIAPELEEVWYQRYGHVALTGEPARFEQYSEAWARWYNVYALRVQEPEKRCIAILFTDITERKQAETKLRASEERLRLASEAAQVGVYEYIPKADRVSWSPLLKTMYGLPADADVTFVQFSELVHPDDRAQTFTRLGKFFHREDLSPYEHEFRIVQADGEVRWHRDQGQVLFSGEGERRGPERMIGVVQDITARKRIEEQMHRVAEMDAFRIMLSDMVRSLTDPSEIQAQTAHVVGDYLQANRVFYAEVESRDGVGYINIHSDYCMDGVPTIAGCHRVDDFGSTVFNHLRTGRTLAVADVNSDPLLTPEERQFNLAIKTQAWLCVPLVKHRHIIAVFTVQQATPRSWTSAEMALVEEIAERTWLAGERARAEAALRESEQKYRSLFNSMDEGFCLIKVLFDPTGNPYDYQFLETNAAFERQTGLVDPLGKTILELVPHHETSWFEVYGRIAQTGVPERFENSAESLGRFYDVYAFRMGEPHEHQVAVLFKDIHERKRREVNAALLAEVSSDFSRLVTAGEIMEAVGAKIGAFMDVPYCYLTAIDKAQDEAVYLNWWCADGMPCLPANTRLSEHVTDEFYKLVEAGEPIVSNDTRTNSITHVEAAALLGASSFITVPFYQGGEWKYLFSIHDVNPRVWREDEIDLVCELGNRLVPRLERARAEQALRDSEMRLSAELRDTQLLQQTSSQLIQENNIDVLYEQILDAAIALMHADMGSLQRLDPDRNELHLLVSRGFHSDSAAYWEWIGSNSGTSCGIALSTRSRVIVPDIEACERILGTDDYAVFQKSNIRAVQTTPLISRNGQLVGMISTHWTQPHQPSERDLNLADVLARQVADLIERRQADLALQESEDRLKRALAIDTVGVFFFNLKGRITEVNDAFLRLSGYSKIDFEVNRLRWQDFTPPEHLPTMLKAIEELESLGRTTPYEKELRCKDGSVCWVLCAAKSLTKTEAVEFIIDISDRKQAEQAREQWAQELNQLNHQLEGLAEELSRRNEDLNEFAHIVSHDLKAPLRGVRNITEWLQDDLGDSIPLDNQEQLNLLARQVDRMNALINDLLEYSRVGRTNQTTELVDVGELVRELVLAWSLPPTVTIRFATSTPTFESNRLNLQQVFSNLIGNAIKYGCEDETGEVIISAEEQPDCYEFAIADQGPGIKPEWHDKIFGIFETLQTNASANTTSTGIGLAIVKKLIEVEGGKIWIESEVGAGATFYFTWPKKPTTDKG
ncbi:MAG: PAS domain S-box protein [Kaiparowitsia implicata GSE-PSE-MK54-09C]|nr:PAS domain S-box protein [Kaiparowitsia implicata GSE-PSE-MK54-09C]